MTLLARSPLHEAHQRLGARFTHFGGWEMPLQYRGALAEHGAVRSSVGAFDVSHLGRFALDGSGAVAAVDRLLSNDLNRIEPGRAQYSLMLDERGGVIDDIILWWSTAGRLIVLPNAANHDRVRHAFGVRPDCVVTDLRPDTVLLAVQGPGSAQVLETVIGECPKRFRVLEGDGWTAAGTGYTGESGAEVMLPIETASSVFEALITAGAEPCGLASRDILRLEMGYPLWGQDIDHTTSPLEAGLEWAVGWDHEFVGRGALAALRHQPLDRALIGFALEGRRVPRTGYTVRSEGRSGRVTSGNFSPALGVGIGLAYVSPPARAGEPMAMAIRDEWVPGRFVDPPFVRR